MKKIVLIILLLMIANQSTTAQNQRGYAVIAHRGVSSEAPENTLSAIRRALELGVDRIEIDVQMTADGEVVLMHDRTLDRTTNGKGEVRKHSLEEIRLLDAGSWFSEKFTGEKVPTLEEVIRLINGRCDLLIEVKNHGGYNPGIEKKVAAAIRENNALSWCWVISLRHRVVRDFHRMEPDIMLQRSYVGKLPLIPVWVSNFLTLRGFKQYPYVSEFNINKGFIGRCTLRKAARAGKKINAWTEDRPEHALKLVEKGVQGIITNRPGLLVGDPKN